MKLQGVLVSVTQDEGVIKRIYVYVIENVILGSPTVKSIKRKNIRLKRSFDFTV